MPAAAAPIPQAPDDGYRLWLRYEPLRKGPRLEEYRVLLAAVEVDGASATLRAARDQLLRGPSGLLASPVSTSVNRDGLLAGTPKSSPAIARLGLEVELATLADEGLLRAADLSAATAAPGRESGRRTSKHARALPVSEPLTEPTQQLAPPQMSEIARAVHGHFFGGLGRPGRRGRG